MLRPYNKGFTLIEIVIVVVLIGIIGSMAATMLFQGSEVFISETKRQGFVSESRSAFWRMMRDIQGQASSEDFKGSDQSNIFLLNAHEQKREYRVGPSGDLDIRKDDGNYNLLSENIITSSNYFYYYDSELNLISPSNSGLSVEDSRKIGMSELKFTFFDNEDTLSLRSYIYPFNFKYGKKMSYHE